MNEEKQIVLVSPAGEDPFRKQAYFLKVKPNIHSSSIDNPFKLPQLPHHFDHQNWALKLKFPGWRLDHQDLQPWFSHLAPIYHSTWKKAGIYEAILNSTYRIKRKKDLVCGFAEKWCCETNTFIFPWGEATITLEDVRVLVGFSVLGDSLFSPLESRELREVEEKLEKERKGLYCSVGRGYVCTWLWMKKFMKSGNELEHEAFLVFWLSRYVFHNTRHDSVNKAVFSIAIRLARGMRIALAPAVLAHVYKDLSMLKMTIVASNGLNAMNEFIDATVFSPFHLVQVWAWERFVELRPIPNAVSCDEEPRLARWNKVDCLNVGNMRRVLDNAGEGFMWRPYAMASKNYVFPEYNAELGKWVLVGQLDDEHGLMSFAMFLSAAQLVGFGTKQIYLPHRVAMQFGFNQNLPYSYVAGHSHTSEKAKFYSPSRLYEAKAMSYLNRCQNSVSRREEKSIPLNKKAKKEAQVTNDSNEANKIFEVTIPSDCSPKDSEKVVQFSTKRNEDNDNLVLPGCPPEGNQMDAGDPMDEERVSLSEVLNHSKTDKHVETKKDGDSEKLSSQGQNLVSSSVEKGDGITMSSEGMKEVLNTEALTGTSKAKCDVQTATDCDTGSANNYVAGTIGKECASSSVCFETRVKRLYLLS